MKRYLIFFVMIFTFFIGYNNVFAQSSVNFDTNYYINFTDDYFTNEQNDYFKNIIDLRSDYYNLVIMYNKPYVSRLTIRFYLVPKNIDTIDFSVGGEFYNSNSSFSYKLYEGVKSYYTDDFDTTSYLYNNFINCYVDDNCVSYSVPNSNNDTIDMSFSVPNISINNNSSFSIPFINSSSIGSLIYYSNVNLNFVTTFNPIYATIFYKNLVINGNLYSIGDNIPTYYDLFFNESDTNIDINKELDNYNSLSNFYFRINKSDISNFSFAYEFNPLYALSLVISNPNYFEDFYNDLDVGIMYFGRKYNSTNNYYTYDRIDCTLNHTFIKNSNTINSNGANLSCSTDLTDYDYIYLYIDQFLKSDEYINPTVKYVNLQVNSATYHYGDYIGYIYDKFDNLSSDFEMSFSSNETGFSSVYSNINYGLIAEKVRVNNSEGFVPTALTTQPLEFSYDYSAYYVVFNDSSKYNGTRNIEFFTFPNTIISFSDKENNKFYIYDENKNINSVIGKIQYYLNDTGSYDLNYYFTQVNDYINGLSVQITNLGNLTQNFYDNMPDFVQTFIFIAFILACIYFTYRLIKK